jgi:hypothetical protein
MTRPGRVFVEGGFYHVYNRLGRGERVFSREHDTGVPGPQFRSCGTMVVDGGWLCRGGLGF